jgi:hypothetical protein
MDTRKKIKTTERYSLQVFDSQIEVFRGEDGFLYVPLTTICEIMSLDPEKELQRLTACHLFQESLSIGLVSFPAEPQEIALLRIDMMALWITFLDLNAVVEEYQDEVKTFQYGAALYLHEAFFDGRLTDMGLIASSLHQDLPLVKLYKEAIAIATLVRERLLIQLKENNSV